MRFILHDTQWRKLYVKRKKLFICEISTYFRFVHQNVGPSAHLGFKLSAFSAVKCADASPTPMDKRKSENKNQ